LIAENFLHGRDGETLDLCQIFRKRFKICPSSANTCERGSEKATVPEALESL